MRARRTAPSRHRSTLLLPVVTITAVACVGDGGGTGHDIQGTATSGAPPTDTAVADSTGASSAPSCIDDYHGNQEHQTALDLLLDTTETAFIILGDGFAAEPPELGTDELVVCDAAVSDFFGLEVQCPSFLGIEARAVGVGVPEVLLYDDSIVPSSQPVEQAVGSWSGFFLKPLQWELGLGSYVIEVQHSGGGPQPYSLAVAVLPDSPCPPS